MNYIIILIVAYILIGCAVTFIGKYFDRKYDYDWVTCGFLWPVLVPIFFFLQLLMFVDDLAEKLKYR